MEEEKSYEKENENRNTLGAPDLDNYYAELSKAARKRFHAHVPFPQLIPAPVLRRYLKLLHLWTVLEGAGATHKIPRQLRRIRNYESKLYRNYSPITDDPPGIDTLFGSISLSQEPS